VKTNLRCDGLLPFACRRGSNRHGKTMRAGDGAANPLFLIRTKKYEALVSRILRNSVGTGQTLFIHRLELSLLSFKRGILTGTAKGAHFF